MTKEEVYKQFKILFGKYHTEDAEAMWPIKDFIGSVILEELREVISQIRLPIQDHSKCPLPRSCIGYQNAQSDLKNVINEIIENEHQRGWDI